MKKIMKQLHELLKSLKLLGVLFVVGWLGLFFCKEESTLSQKKAEMLSVPVILSINFRHFIPENRERVDTLANS